MRFLSRLLMKLASFLSPREMEIFKLNIQSSETLLNPPASATPYTQLSTLYRLEPSFIQHMALCQELERRLIGKRFEEAEADLTMAQMPVLPHRNYHPSLRHDGLEWIAEWHEFDAEQPSLVGRGTHPSAALYDFDTKWLGLDVKPPVPEEEEEEESEEEDEGLL